MRIKSLVPLLLAASSHAFTAASVRAVTLEAGEVDIRVHYFTGTWLWNAFDHESSESFALGDTFFRVNAEGERPVPADNAFTFLGEVGAPIWLLPTPQEPTLLFLGLAADGIGPGIFQNDRATVTLLGVAGPGEFALYNVNASGQPHVLMNSRDGFGANDFISLPTVGGHEHANWAFSAPGNYVLTFAPSGALASNADLVSGPSVELRLIVVPEPGSAALLMSGALAFVKRRRSQP